MEENLAYYICYNYIKLDLNNIVPGLKFHCNTNQGLAASPGPLEDKQVPPVVYVV